MCLLYFKAIAFVAGWFWEARERCGGLKAAHEIQGELAGMKCCITIIFFKIQD